MLRKARNATRIYFSPFGTIVFSPNCGLQLGTTYLCIQLNSDLGDDLKLPRSARTDRRLAGHPRPLRMTFASSARACWARRQKSAQAAEQTGAAFVKAPDGRRTPAPQPKTLVSPASALPARGFSRLRLVYGSWDRACLARLRWTRMSRRSSGPAHGTRRAG